MRAKRKYNNNNKHTALAAAKGSLFKGEFSHLFCILLRISSNKWTHND